MATISLNEHWRLTEDGQLQWIVQREKPKAKSERHRWASLAFCVTGEGLLNVALPRHGIIPTEAACHVLERLPARYEPAALGQAVGAERGEAL